MPWRLPDVHERRRTADCLVYRLGFRALRIIHGRGIGVQREMVRAILARTEFVSDFRDAPAEAGGWGATIITLRS